MRKFIFYFSLALTIVPGFAAAAEVELADEGSRDSCRYESEHDTIIDDTYDYLNSKMCEPALWFDNFFVDDRVTQDARAGTMVRWYNDIKYIESEGFEFKTRLSARVNIPKATKRLKLVFDNDSDDKILDLFPNSRSETKNTLGLRYDWLVRERSSLNFKVSLHPGIEARYRYTYPFSKNTYGRVTQKVYQKEKETGESTSLDLDHKINDTFLFRWNNFAKLTTDFDGMELGTGVGLYQFISDTKALSYEASILGRTEPYRYLSNQHLGIRYRQNIFRKWFFYEVSPAIDWREDEYQRRIDETSITLRLEVLFSNF